MVPLACQAQDMKPLEELIDTAAKSYPFARCAGLYQATLEWIGAERMGDDAFQTTDLAYRTVLTVGALVAHQDKIGGTIEHAAKIVNRDARNISNIYIERFQSNYAATGEAFGQDKMFKSDLALCKTVAEWSQNLLNK
jgi:hypothetical protein